MLIHLILCTLAVSGVTILYATISSLSWWLLLPLLLVAYLVLAVLELTAVLLCAIATKNAGPTKARRCFYRLVAHTTAWLSLLCGKHIRATGMEKLPTDTPFLLVSNHLSNLDPLVTIAALRGWELPFVSKPENFRIPFAGAIMRQAAFLAIDRENARNAVTTIKQAIANITTRKLNMGIYPEGTRNKSGKGLLPFHNGSLKIATGAKCPLAVVSLRYEKHTAYVHIIDVLDAAYVAANRTDAISEKVHSLITQDLGIE